MNTDDKHLFKGRLLKVIPTVKKTSSNNTQKLSMLSQDNESSDIGRVPPKMIRFNTLNNIIPNHNNHPSSKRVMTVMSQTNQTSDTNNSNININPQTTKHHTTNHFYPLNKGIKKKETNKSLHRKNISNPFEIDPDDRMFNVINIANGKLKKKKKKKVKKTQQSQNTIKLQGLYQINPKAAIKLEELKKKKKLFSLGNYQDRLIAVMSNSLSKDSIDKLHKTFYCLRSSCNYHYESIIPELNLLEEREEKIINKTNGHIRMYNHLNNSNAETSPFKANLQELQFENVIGRATKQMFYLKKKKQHLKLKPLALTTNTTKVILS